MVANRGSAFSCTAMKLCIFYLLNFITNKIRLKICLIYDRINLRNISNRSFTFDKYVFLHLVKMHALFSHTCHVEIYFVSQQIGACVFLRGFRAAHFLFRRVKMGFAENFKSARIKNGLTQKQIAEKLNIDRSSIAHYESGDSVPSTKNIQKICDMLNLSFEELFR